MVAQDQLMMDRIERLEGRMLTGDPAAERLMQRMDALEENMRTLTGEVERLRFERDQLRAEIQGMSGNIAGAAPDSGEISYWLGESYFVRGGYADAADAYISSMRLDPQGVMAPKAMVGLAATMRELGKKTEACSALGSLTSQYPNASAEVREKARLESARTGC